MSTFLPVLFIQKTRYVVVWRLSFYCYLLCSVRTFSNSKSVSGDLKVNIEMIWAICILKIISACVTRCEKREVLFQIVESHCEFVSFDVGAKYFIFILNELESVQIAWWCCSPPDRFHTKKDHEISPQETYQI